MKKSFFKKVLKIFSYLCFLIIASLTLFEVCFRLQVIDFYKTELDALNIEGKKKESQPTVLIIGDSFSAHPNSYVQKLREHYPSVHFVNAAVPGTGILEHKLIFSNRMKRYEPQYLIYQFYVGNDLTDIEHPINFKELSIYRNIYWLLSERFLCLKYINRKLAVVQLNPSTKTLREKPFSVENYNKRVITYFHADPNHLNGAVMLQEKQKNIYLEWKNKFSELIANVPDSVIISLIVVPHCAQVSKKYTQEMQLLGAHLTENINVSQYPLLEKITQDFPNVKVLNPLPGFQKLEERGMPLFYNNDPHLNPDGQSQLANFLMQNLSFED